MFLGYPEISMAEIKRLYRPGEFRHWFDPETLAFFGEMLPTVGVRTYHGIYFITANSKPDNETRYTIRRQDLEHGGISTVGSYRQYERFAQAKGALVAFLKEKEREDECASTT